MKFSKGAKPNKLVYPLSSVDILKPCRLVNPKIGKHHDIKIPEDFNLIESTNEIIQVRLEVEKGIFPKWFMEKYYPFEGSVPNIIPEPLRIKNLSYNRPKQLANVVHMDLPTDMPFAILDWLVNPKWKQGQNVFNWSPNYINFLETIPEAQEIIIKGVNKGLNDVFEAKYYFGLARPEEVMETINKEVNCKLMTAYIEGCPNHPSFPAGHSGAAGGGALSILNIFPNLTKEQIKIILDTAYLWGMFRSLAGVHHAVDNISGLIVSGLDKYMKKEIVKQYKK